MYLNSYDFENIERIYNLANKKGQIKTYWFSGGSDNLKILSDKLKECRRKLRKIKKEKDTYNTYTFLQLNNELETLKENMEQYHSFYINDVVSKVNSRDFKIEFGTIENDDRKELYYVNNLQSFIAAKIIMNDIRNIYKIFPTDRDSILKRLSLLLCEPFPIIFLRIDIQSFYESIPNDELMTKIKKDALIPAKSQRLLRQIFYSYNKQNNDLSLGIPRGLSFSPYLSELYMKDLDQLIKEIEGVYFYERYVDDIIILAVPNAIITNANQLYSCVQDLFKKYKLRVHSLEETEKTYICDFVKEQTLSFTYLGYQIEVISGSKRKNVCFYLSQQKVDRYKERIKRIFDIYLENASYKPKINNQTGRKYVQPLSKLYRELQFLTGNYRLSGTKSDILSGIYFKHHFLTDISQLKELDLYIEEQLDRLNSNTISKSIFKFPNIVREDYINNMKQYIHSKFSFENGFKNRVMYEIPANCFKIIKKDLL